jgi:protein-tyrosine phosphatase
MGCYTQVTASSLTGNFGADVKDNAFTLINNGLASAIASDCHNLKGRKPDLLLTRELLTKYLTEKTIQDLFINNPKRLSA